MRILGLTFAGSSTPNRTETAEFFRETLGLTPASDAGVEADLFELPDGSTFAVASPGGMGETARSIGFLVDDLEQAGEILESAGLRAGTVAENSRERYLHFRAPDDQVYELVQRK